MTNYYSIVCAKCKTADFIINGNMTHKEAVDYFKKLGWKFGKKKLRCPECASKQTGS